MMIQLINILGECKGGGGASLSQKTRLNKGEKNLVFLANLYVKMPLVIITSAKLVTRKGFLVPGEANKRASFEFQFLLHLWSLSLIGEGRVLANTW